MVEVGVDVPNATVMMIEDAERFGLAQLHQLRGRVGRGARQSYCYLLLNNHSRPSQRLREVEASSDGFHLAEVDMQLRGPGEIYGKAQHGALNLRIASLADSKAIARAKKQRKPLSPVVIHSNTTRSSRQPCSATNGSQRSIKLG